MRENYSHHRRKGSALIIALCLLILVSLLTASIVTLSQISNQTSKISYDRVSAAYRAEGAAARVVWLLLNDKRNFPNRALGAGQDYDSTTDERYLADGVKHSLKYYDGEVDISIYDMVCGINISGWSAERGLAELQNNFENEPDKYEEYKIFMNRVLDYVDTDDFIRPNGGFEKGDYEGIGLMPLPRNYQMQFREEILLIPDASQLFSPDKYGRLSEFQVIPPTTGLSNPSGKQNFFSVSRSRIISKCDLSEEEADSIIEARDLWAKKETSLSESVEPDIMDKLKRQFSFNESGYYTFIIEASSGENSSKRILVCSLRLGASIEGRECCYYEWQFLQ